jgi:peptidyl-prolyl cis-trans isomerase B (cyclophilin B)
MVPASGKVTLRVRETTMGRNRSWKALRGVGLAGAIGLAGCGKSGDAPGGDATVPPVPPAAIPGPGLPEITPPPDTAYTPKDLSPVPAPRLDVPFADATTMKAPEGTTAPPATTTAGEPTAKLQAAVREVWASVKLTDTAGNLSPIVVAIDTEAGPVELTLFPDLAPNHVRNFLALAQVGYFNGLAFERVVRMDYEPEGGGPKKKLEVLTAGCPAGDGEPAHSHLGYFLKPEPKSLQHEEGVVGFVREDDPNSASCRFYLCLTAAPMMDGQFIGFGRVTRGMDVLKTVAARPVKSATSYPESEQFKEPVKIKSVTRK